LLVDKLSPWISGYKKHDVVIAKSPMKLNSVLCKRIIALPGEYVEVEGQRYFVPDGHVWLEGDNKSQSFDSRDFGPVPLNLLEGKVQLKLWDSWKRL
jgi:signal peptidase I